MIRRYARIFPALAILASPTIACRGGQRDRADQDAAEATAVARRFLSAIAAERWDSAAAVLDSAEAVRFRDQHLALLAAIAEHERDITRAMSATGSGGMASVGTAMKLDTGMVARHRAWPVRSLTGDPTLGQLAALPARSFYARLHQSPTYCWWLPQMHGLRIVGTVIDHDSVAYVVYRRSPGDADAGADADTGATARTNAVLELARSNGRWGVRPGRLEPQIDVIALLDTSVARRAMVAGACTPGNRPTMVPDR